MKALYYRIKYLLTANIVDTHLNQYERIAALETYVRDLKYACDCLGFDPAKHGVRPTDKRDYQLQPDHGKREG
jgi:hypothetical protein